MLQYRGGDLAAFRELYARYRDPLFRYLLRSCGEREQAGELFQEVWASVVRARAGYEARARFATWLFKLAHNRLIDEYRRARLPQEPLADDLPIAAPEHEQPEARHQSGIRAQRLLAALAGLPRDQRMAFLMKEEGGLSLEEIAQATGVGRETVKSRLRYALTKLREVLADVL